MVGDGFDALFDVLGCDAEGVCGGGGGEDVVDVEFADEGGGNGKW